MAKKYDGELPESFMNKVMTSLSSSSPAQQAALVSGLKNILNEGQQAQLLEYFSGVQEQANAPEPLGVPTDFSVGSASGTSQIGYRDPSEFGLDEEGGIAGINSASGSLGDLNYDQAFDDLMKQTMAVEEEYLQGRIPADVQEQIEIGSAEQSLTAGLGSGSAARNLTARDLGLTSLQIQQTGVQMATQTAAQLEAKRQFNINAQTAIDQFNSSYALEVDKFMTTVRQQDLTEAELYYSNQQFNAKQALEVNKMITQMVQFGQQLQFLYATTPGVEGTVDTTGLQADVQSIIDDLAALNA